MFLKRTIYVILLTAFVFMSSAQAGTTGKIVGRVIDKSNGEPLIGANILVKDSQLGGATDLDGYYVILNIPPGTYTLQALYVGYQTVDISNVVVSIDLTTTIDFQLSDATLEVAEAITITAERPVVKKDLTATTAVVGDKEIEALPVTEVSEVLELQAGYVDGHLRGGRSGEIAYWIDGIPVTDAYDGGTVVDVSKDMVQELQVVSGAFNAEYGNAMSGIVNIATKDGSNDFGGQFNTYIGDYVSSHENIFWNINDVNPAAIYNFDGSVHGALIKDKLHYYVNARHIYFDGWYQGKREFNPEAIGGLYQGPDDEDPYWYVLGTDANVDSVINAFTLLQNGVDISNPANQAFVDSMYQVLRKNHKSGLGDGEFVPMNWSRKSYVQGKLIYKFSDVIRVMSNTIFDNVDYRDYNRAYKLNPDGDVQRHRRGLTQIFKLSHALSPTTFYDLGLTYFQKKYEEYLYENPNDPRYVHPDALVRLDEYSFNANGTNNHRFMRETQTYLAKLDLTSQLNRVHQFKVGFEAQRHHFDYEDINLRPSDSQRSFDAVYGSPFISPVVLDASTIHTSRYTRKPTEASLYVQDKLEFDDFILNIGVRFDYFDADGRILADPSDPEINKPLKVENRFHDLNGDGVQNVGEPDVTLAEREQYWYKKSKPKYQISPRIGAAFPISSTGKVYFSYGFFFQRPRFELLYTNPDFDLPTSGTGIIGNADLAPEKTVSGEIGIQQQVSEDISIDATVYFRDVRDLTGTSADFVSISGGTNFYAKYTNSDFGLIKGFVVALNKRFSGGLTARLDYTYQVAEGTASDPADAQKAADSGALEEIQLLPLAWDQRHTFNASVTYSQDDWGLSLIGQYGSGLPYTPRRTEDVSSILTNNSVKPQTTNIDLRAYKDFYVDDYKFTAFLRVFNLLDQLNEVGVYDDTGRAGETIDFSRARTTVDPRVQRYNSLNEWFTNATHYSEPRRVELGLTFNF